MKKKYFVRTISTDINELSKTFKVLLVTGPRQVGKTTLLKQIIRDDMKTVDLSNVTDREFAKSDPKAFLEVYSPPVFIDEVQYAPSLFSYIRMLVDNSSEKGLIWMTGSQQFELMEHVSDSLTGRIVIVELQGFSIYERYEKGHLQKPFIPSMSPSKVLEHKNLRETFKIIWQGSFPEVISMDIKERRYFYESYLQSYIQRDVRKIINIKNETIFRTFIKTIAARTSQLLNYDDIAKDVGISPNTVKQWISILRTSGLVYLLQPFSKNITKRLIKTPKLYFLDTGLAAHLSGWTTTESLETGVSAGAFFETFVVSEILKSYLHNGQQPEIYFYRDSDGKEIDLLIHQDNKYYPIEIKKSSTPSLGDVSHINTFANIQGIEVEFSSLICLSPDVQPLSKKVNALSIWHI